jgi:nickel transport protein
MQRAMRTAALLAALAGFLVPGGGAAAQELWLTTSSGEAGPQVRVNFGSPRERRVPSRPKLLSLVAITPDASANLLPEVKPSAPDVPPALVAPLPSKPARTLVAATYDSGYWVTLKDGAKRNTSRLMEPEAEAGRWTVRFAKAALGPEAPWQRVVGHVLEIVPLEVPSASAGAIRFRVLFRGRPLAGAAVFYADNSGDLGQRQPPASVTDEAGVATVPIRQPGMQIVSVSHAEDPSLAPALADRDDYSATFAFRLDEATVN